MKVIWPFDPFKVELKLNNIGIKLITNLFNENDVVETVYISSGNTTGFENIPLSLEIKKNIFYLEKILKESLEFHYFIDFKTTALIAKSSSINSLVKELVYYCDTTSTDLIVMPTNIKKFELLNMNSFSNLMIKLSNISILIFNKETGFLPRHPLKILYAHDFSEKCIKGLEKLLPFVRKWNATLIITYIPQLPEEMTYEHFLIAVEQKTNTLRDSLESTGVNCIIKNIFEIKPIDQILIECVYEMHPEIIALTSQSNNLNIFLGESISRRVFHEITIPMLLIKV